MSVFVSFSAVNGIHFRRHFRLRPKNFKNLFRRPLVYITKDLGLGLEMQSLGLGLEH